MGIIEDGAGTGKKLKVNDLNRAEITSFTTPRFSDVSERDEDAYLFTSNGFITISTADTETGIFYIKNTSKTKHLHLQNIRTCGQNPQKWIAYKNPTGGTLITATDGTKENINFTSGKTADVTVKYGADGTTLSGGNHLDNWINRAGHSIENFEGACILGTNDSIGLTCEVTASTDVCIRVLGFYELTE